MARPSTALRRPEPPPMAGGSGPAVEADRRKGRGAHSNASGRYEPIARVAFDDGCQHGCVYCFARPTHAFLGLSPGLDFESRLFVKPEAPRLLERELSAAGYQPRTIAIGTNTDPYQPIEREYRVMRGILETLERCGHPVASSPSRRWSCAISIFSSA